MVPTNQNNSYMNQSSMLCPYRHKSTTSMNPRGSQETVEDFMPCLREKCVAFQKIGNSCSCNVGNSKWVEQQ